MDLERCAGPIGPRGRPLARQPPEADHAHRALRSIGLRARPCRFEGRPDCERAGGEYGAQGELRRGGDQDRAAEILAHGIEAVAAIVEVVIGACGQATEGSRGRAGDFGGVIEGGDPLAGRQGVQPARAKGDFERTAATAQL